MLHAATREDIAKYAADSKTDIAKVATDNKADNAATIKALENFENRIDRQFQTAHDYNDKQFQKIDHRYNWIIGVTLGTGVTIAGLMVTLASFILKFHH